MNAHICQKTIGRAMISAAQKLTQIEVVKGSIGLKVAGFFRSSGSGRFSQLRIRPWNPYVTTNAATTAISMMKMRARSSPRCSTSVASSPWRIRRGMGRVLLVGGRLGGVGGRLPDLRRLLVLTGDRVLELAHTLAKRVPDLGQPLGPEDEQCDDEDDDHTRDTDFWHEPSLAAFLLRLNSIGLGLDWLHGSAGDQELARLPRGDRPRDRQG